MLRLWLIISVVTFFHVLGQSATSGCDRDGSPSQDYSQLVGKLGSPDFATREDAEKQLRKIGGSAIEALEKGRRSTDNEIRMRSARLLITIRKDDYESRLQAFLISTNADDDFGLPSWNTYYEIVGDDENARQLFVGMQQTEGQLLKKLAENRATTHSSFSERLNSVQSGVSVGFSRGTTLNTLAALLLVAGNDNFPEGNIENRQILIQLIRHQTLANLLTRPTVINQIKESSANGAFAKLIANWMKRLPDDPSLLRAKGILAPQLGLIQFVNDVARATQLERSSPTARAEGIEFVARNGGPEQIKIMESLLDDKTLVQALRKNAELPERTLRRIEIRDVALAACVRLSNMSFSEFGFTRYQGDDDGFPPINEAGFQTEEQRELAMAKWKTGGNSKN